MNTPSVSCDHITDIPRYVEFNHFQAKLDDKSGYDHTALTEDSRTYFGLNWKGWFLVYSTLLFGWSHYLLDGVLVPMSITQRV